MTVARAPARSRSSKRLALPDRKGRELIGLLLLLGGLLLLISLASHRPDDPSVFFVTSEEVPVGNLIGPFGAEISAVGFGLFGLAILAVPILMLWLAWRRLWSKQREPVAGRALGLAIMVAVLPPLCQLALGTVSWRAQPLEAGGALGAFAAGLLEGRLGLMGAVLVTLGALGVGLTLAVQDSLEESAAQGTKRIRGMAERARMAWVRQRERRQRDRSRRDVVAKHLERARKRKDEEEAPTPTPAPEPVRVNPKAGAKEFAIRRVRETPGSTEAAKARKKPAAKEDKGQQNLPMADDSRGPSLPPLNLLELDEERQHAPEDELVRLGERIKERFLEFGVEGSIEAITPGPVLTTYELKPAPGVKVSHVVNLQDDLALSLKAEAIRIDRIPGRATLGIEVPNRQRSVIRLGPLVADEAFRKSPSPLTMALGRTLHGRAFYYDLATMPHLLVAGATGAGKSVGLQSMITSILYKAQPDQVKFIFIDPKRIELGVYSEIPHLKTEVVVEPKKAANALRWAVSEMERRYRLLAEVHVRSIDYYNRAILDPEVQKRLSLKEEEDELDVDRAELQPLPYYVVIIDELADLMMVSSSDVEQSIARLAQMARAVGIHLIVATQRPSVDVLTGTIKANFPCRLSFATATRHDSRTILDQVGAEKLLGKGDMLFLPPGSSRPMRLHGAYVSEAETASLIRWLKRQGKPDLDLSVLDAPVEDRSGAGGPSDEQDELFDDAARLVVSEGQGSASFLQRRMRVGFSRAARLIDLLEQDGILGPAQGSKPREALVKPDYFEEIDRHE